MSHLYRIHFDNGDATRKFRCRSIEEATIICRAFLSGRDGPLGSHSATLFQQDPLDPDAWHRLLMLVDDARSAR